MSHTPKFHADDGSERIKAIRAEFEQHYVCSAFNYEASPLGSEKCDDKWHGWLAAWTQLETESTGLLSLLYDILVAAGDKEGRLMQSELVELIAGLRATSDRQAFLLQRFNVLASVAMDEGYTERSAAIRQCIDEIEDDGQPE